MCDKKYALCPPHFRYKDVLARGKPTHKKSDTFSIKHPSMDLEKRAKIFSPFDALKGFNESIASKDILYEDRRVLSDEDIRHLNHAIGILYNLTKTRQLAMENHVAVSVTYFAPCKDSDNEAFMVRGRYQTLSGILQKVDPFHAKNIIIDGIEVRMSDILSIESQVFDPMDFI